MEPQLAEIVEHNGSKPGNNAYRNEVKRPTTGAGNACTPRKEAPSCYALGGIHRLAARQIFNTAQNRVEQLLHLFLIDAGKGHTQVVPAQGDQAHTIALQQVDP